MFFWNSVEKNVHHLVIFLKQCKYYHDLFENFAQQLHSTDSYGVNEIKVRSLLCYDNLGFPGFIYVSVSTKYL